MSKPSVIMHAMTSPNGQEIYVNPKLVRYMSKGFAYADKNLPVTILAYSKDDRIEVRQTPSQVLRIFGLLSPEGNRE